MAEQEEKKQGNISAEGQKLVKEGEAVKEYGQMLLAVSYTHLAPG